MTIFTDGPRLEPESIGIHEVPASLGDSLAATAGDAFESLPTLSSLPRMLELSTASGLGLSGAERAAIPDVPLDQAKARVKDAGLDKILHLGDAPTIKAPALDIMLERAQARREREATIARGPGGIVAGALGVGTSLLVSAIDPLNIAAAFIPVIGEARYAKMMADAGTGVLARAAVRTQVGAASGAVGMAAIEPIEYLARNQEGQDYTMAEALRSVMYGAALGGLLHSGGGAVADVLRGRKGAPVYPFDIGEPHEFHTPFEELRTPRPAETVPESPMRQNALGGPEVPARAETPLHAAPAAEVHPAVAALDDLPPRAKEDVLRASIAALHDGEPVRTGEMLQAAARSDARIAESLNGGRPTVRERPQSLLEFIAAQGGVKDSDPLIADLMQSFGGKNRGVPGVGMVVTKTGKSLDAMREAAVEAGYLHDAGASRGTVTESTIEDLLAAVDREARGQKVYPAGYEGFKSKADLAAENEHDQHLREQYRRDVDQAMETALDDREIGTMRPQFKTRAMTIMQREGIRDPEVAIERALQEYGMARAPINVDQSWRELSQRRPEFDEPAAVEASQAAAKLPQPESLSPEPSKRVQAAEKAAAEAEADYKANADYIPDEIKAKVEHELKALEAEGADRAEVIKRGAACLAAAVGAMA